MKKQERTPHLITAPNNSVLKIAKYFTSSASEFNLF